MVASVIVPLYRGRQYIDSIVRMIKQNAQVLGEVYSDALVELVFVGDYPNDNSEIIITPNDDIDISLIEHKENLGIHQSRIDGLKAAKGDYVLFLDQDDEIEDDYLYSQVRMLNDNDACLSICNGIYREDKLIYEDEAAAAKAVDDTSYFGSMVEIISPGQVLLKRDAVPETWCKYILKHNYCDDAFLWMLLKDMKAKAVYNDKVLYKHNEDGSNTSFAWKENADALRELRTVIIEKACLKPENLRLFLYGSEKEIIKQDTYAILEEAFNKAEYKKRLLKTVVEGDINIIYGFGYWGKKLYELMVSCDVKVEAIVDKAALGYRGEVSVFKPQWLKELPFGQKKKAHIYLAAPMAALFIRDDLRKWGFDKIYLINEI
jgi:glycosyltransferase involved in cell wall biosynthesis